MNDLLDGSDIDLTTNDGITQLEARVHCLLGGRRVYDFRVLVVENGVVLHGDACSYYAKQLAQHTVMKATTLPIVANEIKVSRSFERGIARPEENRTPGRRGPQ